MSARNVVIILVGYILWMYLSYFFLVAAMPSLSGILVYNYLTSIMPKIE